VRPKIAGVQNAFSPCLDSIRKIGITSHPGGNYVMTNFDEGTPFDPGPPT